MLSWEAAKPFFERDGALRDLYAFGVTSVHWQRFLEWVRSGGIAYSFVVEGTPAELPERVETVFDLARQQSVLLILRPSFGEVNCHFFSQEELELDLWPTDIKSEREYRELLDLVEKLAVAIGAEICVTPESWPKFKLFTYDPVSHTYVL